jgi:hypothetical protein
MVNHTYFQLNNNSIPGANPLKATSRTTISPSANKRAWMAWSANRNASATGPKSASSLNQNAPSSSNFVPAKTPFGAPPGAAPSSRLGGAASPPPAASPISSGVSAHPISPQVKANNREAWKNWSAKRDQTQNSGG